MSAFNQAPQRRQKNSYQMQQPGKALFTLAILRSDFEVKVIFALAISESVLIVKRVFFRGGKLYNKTTCYI